MAVTQYSRMQQLRGNYADLDKTKMLVGEMAVSTDHAPIIKADTNKYYELLTAEDADYLQNLTDEVQNTLEDVTQLAIDKVGINDEVESKVQTFSSEKIMNLHENQFKVLSGTEIVANDSSSGYATDFSCVGKVEQKQYSGKNLLNNTATTKKDWGITITTNNDKSLTVIGTTTQECSIELSGTWILSAGTYTVSGNPVSDGITRVSVLKIENGAITEAYADSGSGKTFTLSESSTVRAILVFKGGATFNHTFYPMVSTSGGDYEPYTGGASPNPSYPQAIMNSGDCVELQQGVYQTNSGALTTSGITTYLCNKYPIPCKSGDVLGINVELETIKGVHFLFYNESGYISYLTVYATSGTVTVPSGATYFNIDIVGADGVKITTETVGKVELTINGKYVLQIKSVGTNAESVATILLNEPLRAANDVKDVIEYVNDGYKVRRKIKSIVFDGVNNKFDFKSGSTNNNGYKLDMSSYGDIKPIASGNVKGNIICSHAICEINAILYGRDTTGISQTASGTAQQIYFWFGANSEITTVALANEWLAENPITVQCEMAEEVIEDIADQTPFYNILTYDGGTTISTTDRLQPQIEVEYPTAKSAGIASVGFAKGNLALAKLEQMTTATTTVAE